MARYCDEECQANDSWHLGDCCFNLACEWDGVGPMPSRLLDPNAIRHWGDPSVIPNARARERLAKDAREFCKALQASRGL